MNFINNKDVGQYGERLAYKYLQNKNYRILSCNFRIKIGEIDIIAVDGDTLCFIEVKTRFNLKFGSPCLSVTATKQLKIKKVAEVYLLKNRYNYKSIRFDIVEVLLNYINDEFKINHIKSAFY